MTLHLSFQDAEGYLHTCLTGAWNLAAAKDAVAAIGMESTRRNQHRVFIDMTGIGAMPFIDSYDVSEHAAGEWRGKMAVSILFRREPINRMIEIVAVNRGAKVKVSSDREQALDWLASA